MIERETVKEILCYLTDKGYLNKKKLEDLMFEYPSLEVIVKKGGEQARGNFRNYLYYISGFAHSNHPRDLERCDFQVCSLLKQSIKELEDATV